MVIFDETTTTVDKSYPQRLDISDFLTTINTWWAISNSKEQFSPNIFGNAIFNGDGKTDFQIGLKIGVNAQCLL